MGRLKSDLVHYISYSNFSKTWTDMVAAFWEVREGLFCMNIVSWNLTFGDDYDADFVNYYMNKFCSKS